MVESPVVGKKYKVSLSDRLNPGAIGVLNRMLGPDHCLLDKVDPETGIVSTRLAVIANINEIEEIV